MTSTAQVRAILEYARNEQTSASFWAQLTPERAKRIRQALRKWRALREARVRMLDVALSSLLGLVSLSTICFAHPLDVRPWVQDMALVCLVLSMCSIAHALVRKVYPDTRFGVLEDAMQPLSRLPQAERHAMQLTISSEEVRQFHLRVLSMERDLLVGDYDAMCGLAEIEEQLARSSLPLFEDTATG